MNARIHAWFGILPAILRKAGAVVFIVLGLALGLACGGGKEPGAEAGPGYHHPTGWTADHVGPALAAVDRCTLCHSMNILRVGSSIPNCLTAACHHGTLPGYALPGLHGLHAKQAATTSGGSMAACQLCHGRDFTGGTSAVACASCHGGGPAPHPGNGWHGASGSNHASTDPANGPLCAQCHFPGSAVNPPNHPAAPAPAGTAPGCFSNTECHGPAAAPHLLGSVWKDATSTAFHGLEAKKDLLACQTCHGTPGTPRFDGGAAPTACSVCHGAAKAHSIPWHAAPVTTFPGYVASHRTAQNRDNACQVCHDSTKGRTPPNPAAPSCFANTANGVACHVNGPGAANHPVPFLAPAHTSVIQAGFAADCATCHAQAAPSPLAASPSCGTCHGAASPLAVGTCASCHTKPPAGTQFPNSAGSHPKHDALPAVTGQCAPCHSGLDSGTQAHYDHANARPGRDALRVAPAPTGFLTNYNAKSGPAAFNPATQTCSNVSCHGALIAPSWQTGTLATNTDPGCRQCHAQGTALGVPESNAYYSGQHGKHLGSEVKALCTDCHVMTNGSPGALNHFKFLGSTQMEGPAGDTVGFTVTPATYDRTARTCTLTCHSETHNALRW